MPRYFAKLESNYNDKYFIRPIFEMISKPSSNTVEWERVKILDNLLRWKERRNAQKMEAENGKIQKAI